MSPVEAAYVPPVASLPALIVKNDRVFADSRDVAEAFGKRHDNVLRDIRALIAQGVLNFEETPHVNPQNGQTYQTYLMDRDGFMQLVMGFTGAEAIRWRRAFITAFNAMQAELRSRAAPRALLTREQRIAAAPLESQEVIAERRLSLPCSSKGTCRAPCLMRCYPTARPYEAQSCVAWDLR